MTVEAATTAVAAGTRLQFGLAALKNQLETERAAASLATQALEQGRQGAPAAGNGRLVDILV